MANKFEPGNKQDVTKLNERQKKFVDYYLQSGNLSESARKAGYTKKSCATTANELIKNPKIQNAINARLKEMESERLAETQEILEYLTAVMRGEKDEEIVVNVGTGKGYTQAQKVRAQVGAKERLKAAEMLAKVKGLFISKSEVDLNGAIPVVIVDDF